MSCTRIVQTESSTVTTKKNVMSNSATCFTKLVQTRDFANLHNDCSWTRTQFSLPNTTRFMSERDTPRLLRFVVFDLMAQLAPNSSLRKCLCSNDSPSLLQAPAELSQVRIQGDTARDNPAEIKSGGFACCAGVAPSQMEQQECANRLTKHIYPIYGNAKR